MKKTLSWLLVVLMILTAPLSVVAEATLVSTKTLESSAGLCEGTNLYYSRGSVYDAEGNLVAGPYGSLNLRQDGLYFEVANENGLNNLGVIDAAGAEVLPLAYGDVLYVNDDWMLGVVLEATSDVNGDYKDYDGNQYNIARTDVVYNKQVIGSLSREDFNGSSNYGARGAFMYVKSSSSTGFWLDASFHRVDVSADYFSTSEFTEEYKKGVLHNPTQTYAFTPACTLTPDQVERSVWYDEDGNFVDLQGNVISKGPSDYKEYDSVSYYGGDYMVIRANGKRGLVNMQGEEVIPAVYESMAGDNEGTHFASGYQAVVDEKGSLLFLDKAGNVTASVAYNLSDSDYKGFYYNAPIIAVKGMGSFYIVTATHGELPTKYEDAYTVQSAYQRIMAVQQDGLWGCIDMSGNTVIPFVHRNAPEISHDGMLVLGVNEDRDYILYTVAYPEGEPVVEVVEEETYSDMPTVTKMSGVDSLQEGEWICSECGTVGNGKFCSECGAKKAEAAACSGCGYVPAEGTSPKFCPECGTKFE